MDALLCRLRGIGLSISVDGGNLAVQPKALITDEIRVLIREHKTELLTVLSTPATTEAINADAIEFFEERAAIAEFDGGLSREEAEKEAREATERHRRECWERHQRNAERILSLQTWAAREQALERYRTSAVAQYGDKAGATMAKEMGAWIRFRSGLTAP